MCTDFLGICTLKYEIQKAVGVTHSMPTVYSTFLLTVASLSKTLVPIIRAQSFLYSVVKECWKNDICQWKSNTLILGSCIQIAKRKVFKKKASKALQTQLQPTKTFGFAEITQQRSSATAPYLAGFLQRTQHRGARHHLFHQGGRPRGQRGPSVTAGQACPFFSRQEKRWCSWPLPFTACHSSADLFWEKC